MLKYRGCNLTGGDTYWKNWSFSTGPTDQQHYRLVTNQDIDYLVGKGMNAFRLVMAWEAISQFPGTVGQGAVGYQKYWAGVQSRIDYITNTKKCSVLLDFHGGDNATFGTYRGTPVTDSIVTEYFRKTWVEIAKLYGNNFRVKYGLMNEPFNMPTKDWFNVANAAVGINGIRGYSKELVATPGNYFTGPGTWNSTSMFDTGNPKVTNANGWTVMNPDSNRCAQVHLYLDANSGGGATDIVSPTIAVERLRPVRDWAKATGNKVLVAEVGFQAANSLAKEAAKNMFDFMNDNDDVFLGWLWWAYGPPSWWGGYKFTLCPTNNYTLDSPQMNLIKEYLK